MYMNTKTIFKLKNSSDAGENGEVEAKQEGGV